MLVVDAFGSEQGSMFQLKMLVWYIIPFPIGLALHAVTDPVSLLAVYVGQC